MMIIKRKKSRKLDLSSKNLNRFPPYIFNDKNIVSLDLSNNNIQEIPANIGLLRRLRYLNLENNKIQVSDNGRGVPFFCILSNPRECVFYR